MRVCARVHRRERVPASDNLTYPAYKAHAPYCLRPLWLHHIFRHFLINGTIFGKTLLNILCVFWISLQLLFETFLIVTIIQRDIVIKVKRLHVKYPLFLMNLNSTWNFSTYFPKKHKQNIIQILPVGTKLLHASRWMDGRTDWRTDMTKLTVAFRNFANAPKNAIKPFEI